MFADDCGAKPDTVESVLAEMLEKAGLEPYVASSTVMRLHDRLAAAHAREESAWSKLMTGELDKRRATEVRAEAAEAKLHELQDALLPLAGPFAEGLRGRLTGAPR